MIILLVYNPEEKCTIKNTFDVSNITGEIEGNLLPLDSVNDILEWNLLLNKCYFTPTTKIMLYMLLIKSCTKDLCFDFSKFDTYNKTKGSEILKKILISRFDIDV